MENNEEDLQELEEPLIITCSGGIVIPAPGGGTDG